MKINNFLLTITLVLNSKLVCAQSVIDKLEQSENIKIKYKESSRLDFESLLIEGERKKPELSVVTGSIGEKDNGILVFRKDFKDTMTNDFGEVIE